MIPVTGGKFVLNFPPVPLVSLILVDGGIFSTGVNDTGGKLTPITMTLAVNLPGK